MGHRATIVLALALALVACSDPTLPPGPADAGAPDGPDSCGAGTAPLDGGGCRPAGVPPELCGEGFEADGEGGCVAILPPEPCARGSMAVPGETACHEIAPCGEGTWGTIPIEPNTEFVDGSYLGGASDGSQANPWNTVQEGIDAALPGAIVAIAAGSYTGNWAVIDKAVRLWGKCPSAVELIVPTQTPAGVALFVFEDGAAGTEVHDLAVTGRGYGFAASAPDVLLDRVWLHDTDVPAFGALDAYSETSVVVRRSLIEGSGQIGVYLAGADITLEQSVVRDSRPEPSGKAGVGVSVLVSPMSGKRSRATLRGSVLEQNRAGGLVAIGGDAVFESSIVRDTAPQDSDQGDGEGIVADYDVKAHERSTLTVTSTVVQANHEVGVVVHDSDGTIETTTVRATVPQAADGLGGFAIAVQTSAGTDRHAQLSVSQSALLDNPGVGILVVDADATIDGVLILRTPPSGGENPVGDGILALSTTRRATAAITASRVLSSERAAISSFGAQVTLGATALECNAINLDGEVNSVGAYEFEDLGGNVCGCAPTSIECKVLSSGLAPPPPL